MSVYDDDEPPVPAGLVSEPGIFDCIETWEHWLTEVEDWPDSPMKKYCIWSAKRTIEWKKRHLRAQRLGVEWLH
jgi:hypothetical protein